MARPSILSLIAVCCLISLGSTSLATRASSDSSLTLLAVNSSDRIWYWVSGDGSQVVPINGPQDTPTNVTATNGLPNAGTSQSYTFSFGNYHGAPIPRPALANFLFDCEFGLFDQVPASGRGVWTPYPRGKYVCKGDLDGAVSLKVIGNHFGWSMTIHDVALLIKVMHETEGVKDGSRFFDFVVNYTNEADLQPFETVAYGKWESTGAITAGTSSQ